jgi:hypothetical protein
MNQGLAHIAFGNDSGSLSAMRLLPMLIGAGLSGVILCQPVLADGAARIIPRPQVENYGDDLIPLATRAGKVQVVFKNTSPADSAACNQTFRILSKRLRLLGADDTVIGTSQAKAQIVVIKTSPREFSRDLRKHSGAEKITGKRLEQAYTLECRTASKGRGQVHIKACGDLGIYYGAVSLCQLMDQDQQGSIRVPSAKLVDWPEIGLRLAKTSASTLPLPELRNFAAWMPLYKINAVGLQYHGTNSLHPEPFPQNVKAICSEARQRGILETVVYFCPFRGKGYDFSTTADQQKYAQFLQWMLDQGAQGIEVDYNDWPGKGTAIEDVINLACRAVAERNPAAYMLYCPPSRGTSMYRGPASPEMIRILSKVPTNVWPLWTGMAIKNALIDEPLNPADVEAWTRATGHRPFLWVNRVVMRDKPHNHPFARPVEEVPGSFAFRGEYLPKDLNRLFEGIHFNAGSPGYTPSESKPELLAYLATAADYVWNPQGWEAVESCRRAKRFVEIMTPLLEK